MEIFYDKLFISFYKSKTIKRKKKHARTLPVVVETAPSLWLGIGLAMQSGFACSPQALYPLPRCVCVCVCM